MYTFNYSSFPEVFGDTTRTSSRKVVIPGLYAVQAAETLVSRLQVESQETGKS